MATPSGMAVFFDPKVNAMLKKVLNVWGEFLQSPESAYVLDDNAKIGWLGKHGVKHLVTVANLGVSNHSFDELFICDPTAKNHGFKSWVSAEPHGLKQSCAHRQYSPGRLLYPALQGGSAAGGLT